GFLEKSTRKTFQRISACLRTNMPPARASRMIKAAMVAWLWTLTIPRQRGALDEVHQKKLSKGQDSGLHSLLSSDGPAGMAPSADSAGIRGIRATGGDHAQDRPAQPERARGLHLRGRCTRRRLAHRSLDCRSTPAPFGR